MKWQLHEEPFHYLIIEDLFTQEERDTMFDEMTYYERSGIMEDPVDTGGARDEKGEGLKQNKGIELDALYTERKFSNILRINRKLFQVLNMVNNSWFFKEIWVNSDRTLLSYYENSDYYRSHKDAFIFTALTWFYKEPKRFTGGDLVFSDYDLTIPCEENITIVFPSNQYHVVTEVKMDDEYLGKGNGRFTMTQFGTQLQPYDPWEEKGQ